MLRLLLILSVMFPLTAFAELDIREAWIKNLPPSTPVRAGYMNIHNPDQVAVSVVEIRSKAFASVEIHQTIERDGMMRMDPVPSLKIEAGSSVQLAPGGLHLMMMNPEQPTRPGDIIEILLVLDDGSEQSLKMLVKK
jgi:copper(I)-binding protein